MKLPPVSVQDGYHGRDTIFSIFMFEGCEVKTLTDYLDNARPSRIKSLESKGKDSPIEFDSSSCTDVIILLREVLSFSMLSMKPVVIRNFDFLNERIVAIIGCAKQISSARAYHENGSLYFIPKKISFSEKDFSYDRGVISEMIQVVLPVMMFSPKNTILNFDGMTEYHKSIDFFSSSVLPFLVPFCDLELNVLERGFIGEKPGKARLVIRPRFRFNKSIYDEEIKERYETVMQFCSRVRNSMKSVESHDKRFRSQSVRCMICAPKSSMQQIEDDLKRPIDLVLRNLRIPASIKVEYSSIDSSNVSITLYSILSGSGEIDFQKMGSFDILSKSIVINNLEKRNVTKLLQDVTSFCTDVQDDKHRYDDLQGETGIYDILFGRRTSHMLDKFMGQ